MSEETAYTKGGFGGRPPHYKTPEELNDKCTKYFEECKSLNEKATITGLALFLGFVSRQSFADYSQRDKAFSDIIKRAKLAVENSYEKGGNAIDIFALKVMGWKETQDSNAGVNINIIGGENLE